MREPTTEEHISEVELRRRVLLSMLGPVVRLADHFGISLRELTAWVRLAYFKDQRDRGLSLSQISDKLDVSERTSKALSRQLRESFFLPEQAHNLPTLIELMLWRVPMSEARLCQVLPQHSAEAVRAALDVLEREGRVAAHAGRTTTYAPTQSVNAQVQPQWVKRIGGLNSLMGNLFDVVRGRFFERDERAFARTMSFTVSPDQLDALDALFLEVMVPAIADLDARSHDDPEALSLRMSLCWAPWSDTKPPNLSKSRQPRSLDHDTTCDPLAALLIVSALSLSACGADPEPNTTPELDCGSGVKATVGADTCCVYDGALIMEGFSCPSGMVQHNLPGITACGPSGVATGPLPHPTCP